VCGKGVKTYSKPSAVAAEAALLPTCAVRSVNASSSF